MLSRSNYIWLLSFILVISCTDSTTDAINVYQLTEAEKLQFQPGDIILRRGEGMVSSAIASVLQEPYDVTHCGMLAKTSTGWAVIHAMEDESRGIDGIIAQDLDQFVRESRDGSIIVVRYKLLHADGQELVDHSLNYLQADIPFDRSFDIFDDKKFYCSELLQHVYLECVGADIFPERIKAPSTDLLKYTYLFDESVFQPILNHQR